MYWDGEAAFEYTLALKTRVEAMDREDLIDEWADETFQYFVQLDYPNQAGLSWAKKNAKRLINEHDERIARAEQVQGCRVFEANQYYMLWYGFETRQQALTFILMERC